MTTIMILLNIVFAALVFGGMLTLLGHGIHHDRRFAALMHRQGRATVVELADSGEDAWREAA